MSIYAKVIRNLKSPERLRGMAGRVVRTWQLGGVAGLRHFMKKKMREWKEVTRYMEWHEVHSKLTSEDRTAIRKRIQAMPSKPLISVLMPVYNVPEIWLKKAIESVRSQLYPNWELCIADDASSAPHVRQILQKYAARDPRIKVAYRELNGHISAASNSALELASDEFVALLDHDDELTEHALYMIAEELQVQPDADLIYSDEDKIDSKGRHLDPHFKPEWNPDLMLSYNMVTHLAVFRRKLVEEVGGFRLGFEGSQDWDLTLRVSERTVPARIRHIPHVLYHWRVLSGSTAKGAGEKPYALESGRKAVQDHLIRSGSDAEVLDGVMDRFRIKYPLPENPPKVSVVICTRDRLKLLRGAVSGMLEKTDYPNLEVIVVDNQSAEPETLAYFKDIQRDPRVRILKYDAPFNFSAINNYGVAQATGEVIALINNDIEVIHADWLREMVTHAMRPEVGAVGAKLYYADDRIQHAGVVLGIGVLPNCSHGVAGHSHKYFSRYDAGYMSRLVVVQNYSAVTAACIVLRKSVFEEVGGLDAENLIVAFNDVDFCLKIVEKGYRIVFTPFAELYHLESASRGTEDTPEKVARFNREVDYMLKKWSYLLARDRAYSPNLSLITEQFELAESPRVRKPWKA